MMVNVKSLLVALYIAGVTAQTESSATASASACSSTIAPKNGQPSVAPGWSAHVVASGLTKPRGIKFDSEGNLLVLQSGKGVSRLKLKGEGACVQIDGQVEDVIGNNELNHGMDFSADGRTLYASTPDIVYAWDYDPTQGKTTSESREIITRINEVSDGHSTRTLMVSKKAPGIILVSRGSTSNLDDLALDQTSGVSTIKSFNLTNITSTPYNFPSDGAILGWGLRNSVGIAEDPTTGSIYSVENSVDNLSRNGQTIYENNPAEELNYHGALLNSTSPEKGRNYGYPTCYTAWSVPEIPDNDNLKVGTQFAIGDTKNDSLCANERQPPRLAFQAHQAPLDILFNSKGTAAWITFHGSWNRDHPIGYKVSVVPFKNGEPVDESTSMTAALDIMSNPDLSSCPGECFRPVGLAWDKEGKGLFVTSDSTGEVWVIGRGDGGKVDDVGSGDSSALPPSPSGGAPPPPPAESSSAAEVGVLLWDGGSGIAGRFWGVWAAVLALPFAV